MDKDLVAPDKLEIEVGYYDDGSGPELRVSIDKTAQHAPECIWIEHGISDDRWIAFDWRRTDELIDALKAARDTLSTPNREVSDA